MICRGKRKSIYRACEECKRGMKAIGGDSAPSGAMSSVFAVGVSAIVGESIMVHWKGRRRGCRYLQRR